MALPIRKVAVRHALAGAGFGFGAAEVADGVGAERQLALNVHGARVADLSGRCKSTRNSELINKIIGNKT